MTRLTAAVAVALIVFAVALALAVADRIDRITVAVLGGATVGILSTIPIVALCVWTMFRIADRRPAGRDDARVVSPLTGASFSVSRPADVIEVNAPVIHSARDHRRPTTGREIIEADPPPAQQQPAVTVFASTVGDAMNRQIIRARRDDVLTVMRMWPADPTRENWRGTAARYGTTCQFLAAHGLLTARGRSWGWSNVKRGRDLADFVAALDAGARA